MCFSLSNFFDWHVHIKLGEWNFHDSGVLTNNNLFVQPFMFSITSSSTWRKSCDVDYGWKRKYMLILIFCKFEYEASLCSLSVCFTPISKYFVFSTNEICEKFQHDILLRNPISISDTVPEQLIFLQMQWNNTCESRAYCDIFKTFSYTNSSFNLANLIENVIESLFCSDDDLIIFWHSCANWSNAKC